jgi:hypothetical protein
MPAAGQIQFLEVSISSLEVNQEPPLAFKSWLHFLSHGLLHLQDSGASNPIAISNFWLLLPVGENVLLLNGS